MRKWIALILTVVFLAGCFTAAAEEAFDASNKYEQLTVGVTTAFSGNFLSDGLGNNISDQDIRKMIHGYHLVRWDGEEGIFRMNEQVVTSTVASEDQRTFVFTLAKDLTYNDGTPITARDYAFSFLLLTSQQILNASGLRDDGSRVEGWKAYDEGYAPAVSGFRLIGDYQMAITVSQEYTPYFYELKALDLYPLPAEVLLPGCEVRDDGNGIYIRGGFSGDELKQTLLDPESGYASHPSVTCGPYSFVNYDGKTVWLTRNDTFKGDENGKLPYIRDITVRYIASDDLLPQVISGVVDLAVRCIRLDQFNTGRALVQGEDYGLKTYSRNGLAFISFCGEKGPTADVNVRKALAMCIDKDTLIADYMGMMGTAVKGYYGIGQWMFPMTRGMIPDSWKEEGEEDEDFADMNLDGLTEYTLNPEEAARLLDAAGWNLNAEGGAYTEGLRYKMEGGELVPLRLHMIYPDQNKSGKMLETLFAPYLQQAGAEIEFTAVSMPVLLRMYYGQQERDCDMILVGSNFQDVFDPYVYYDENGKDRLNGITDRRLADLALEMRKTEPGNGPEYIRRWIRFLEYRSEVVPEIPLYSNAYADFMTTSLRNYNPGIYSSWSEAVQDAYLSDFEEGDNEDFEEPAEGSEWFD